MQANQRPRRSISLVTRAASVVFAEVLENRLLLAVAPVGPEFRVNESTLGDQSTPAIAMDADGDSVVAWSGYANDGGDPAIFARLYDATGNAKGPEMRVSSPGGDDPQERPVVSMDADGDFVVAWHNDLNGPIYARRYAADGTALGGTFLVAGDAQTSVRNPTIATAPDDTFIIAWTEHDLSPRVVARRYGADGAPLGGEITVNTAPGWVLESPSIAIDPSGAFVIAWDNWNDHEMHAQRFSPTGEKRGAELTVSTDSPHFKFRPDVVVDDAGNFIVAWSSEEQDGDGIGIFARRFSADGQPAGAEFRVNETTVGNQGLPRMAIRDGQLVVIWNSVDQAGIDSGIFARTYDLAGNPTRGEFRVNSFATGHQNYGDVALDRAGHPTFTWQSEGQDGSGYGVFAQRYALVADPASLGGRVWHDENADGIQGAGEPGLEGVSVELVSAAGSIAGTTRTTGSDGDYHFDHLRPGEAYRVRVVPSNQWTFAPAEQGADDQLDSDADATGTTAAIVLEAGQSDLSVDAGLVRAATVTGTVYHDTDADGVRETTDKPLSRWTVFVDEDGDGRLDSGEASAETDDDGTFAIRGLAAGTHRVAVVRRADWAVASPATGFVSVSVTRGQTVGDTDFGVRPTGRRVVVSAASDEFPVTAPSSNSAFSSSIAMDAAGNSVVVWEAYEDGGGGTRVFARVFDPAGNPLTDEIPVDPDGSASQYGAKVVAGGAGGFVVVWSVAHEDGYPAAVHARSFDATGTPRGERSVVTSPESGLAQDYSVAVEDDGDFIVTWQWASGDYNAWSSDIYARRYDAAGAPKGAEFRVNTIVSGDQSQPLVVTDAAGNAIVFWGSFYVGGLSGIRMQRYDALGTPVGPEAAFRGDAPPSGYFGGVTMSDNGLFLVTWVVPVNSGIFDVYHQRFDAGATALEPSLFFGTVYTGSDSYLATNGTTAINDAGEYVVAWASTIAEGGEDLDVFLRFYNASGVQQGPDLRVSGESELIDEYPGLAMHPDGGVAVVWHSRDRQGTVANINSRRFGTAAAQAPVASAVTNRSVPLNESTASADLHALFDDADHADSALAFDVISNTNPDLFQSVSIDAETGALTAGFRPGATGVATLTVRATDPTALFADTTIVLTRTNGITLTGDDTFTLTTAQSLGAVALSGTSRLVLAPGGPGVFSAQSLSIADDATLDVGSSDLLLSTTPATRDALLASLTARIASARNGPGGRWTGPGLTSAAAAADPLMTLALDTLSSYVLVKYTYNGDANFDGQITSDDYFRIDSGFLAQPAAPTYAQGDFNYDGSITSDDYFLIDSAFLGQAATSAAGPLSEPVAASASAPVSTHRRDAATGVIDGASLKKRRRTVRVSPIA